MATFIAAYSKDSFQGSFEFEAFGNEDALSRLKSIQTTGEFYGELQPFVHRGRSYRDDVQVYGLAFKHANNDHLLAFAAPNIEEAKHRAKIIATGTIKLHGELCGASSMFQSPVEPDRQIYPSFPKHLL